jgi:ATP-dependent exoDNAse (exonuclease V) alpha subunit
MVADVALHFNAGNPHAHIMLTMREMGPEGLAAKKNREWNKPELLLHWREEWATHANRALERAGREELIDHRSLAEQGSDRLPQVHLGPISAALERRGVSTEKGAHNRLVAEHNSVVIDLEQARQERRQLQAEKVVMERYGARLRAGWIPDHAQALAKLEYRLDGGELKFDDVSRLIEESRTKVHELEQQVLAIRQEGERLDKAVAILGDRREAAAQVDRMRSPLAAVKRWFSADARQEFAVAESRLKGLDQAAQQIGTTSEAELDQQRQRWQLDMARVPALEEQGARHAQDAALASKALEGFARETERYLEILRGGRVRSRDTGRDR